MKVKKEGSQEDTIERHNTSGEQTVQIYNRNK